MKRIDWSASVFEPARGDRAWQTRSLRYVFVAPALSAVCVGCALTARWRPLWAGLTGYVAFAGLQLIGFGVLSILERQGRRRPARSVFGG